MEYKIISAWNGTEGDFLQLKKGDIVQLGNKSETTKWKNWQECSLDNITAWVPIQIINAISEVKGEIREDYSAFELQTDVGDTFKCIKEMNGWLFGYIISRESTKGWIPEETAQLTETAVTPVNNTDIKDLVHFIEKYKIENNRKITQELLEKSESAIREVITAEHSYAYKYLNSEGRFSGYMIFHILNFPMINGREAYISELFIDKEHRGKGIGKDFLKTAECIARRKQCTRIMLNNPKENESYNRGFYAKNGYTERTNFANFVKDLSK